MADGPTRVALWQCRHTGHFNSSTIFLFSCFPARSLPVTEVWVPTLYPYSESCNPLIPWDKGSGELYFPLQLLGYYSRNGPQWGIGNINNEFNSFGGWAEYRRSFEATKGFKQSYCKRRDSGSQSGQWATLYRISRIPSPTTMHSQSNAKPYQTSVVYHRSEALTNPVQTYRDNAKSWDC